MKTGHEVLGVDTDERIVQNMSQELTHTVRADTTDEATLKELGISEFDSAVVAIGADLEASILTTALLLQLGVPNVWAKANSTSHGLILSMRWASESPTWFLARPLTMCRSITTL
jgi:trk system potassium uptake protein TrkA